MEDLKLRRAYLLYTNSSDGIIKVRDYKDNVMLRERPVSKAEIDFLSQMSSKMNKKEIVVNHNAGKKILFFRPFPMEMFWLVKRKKRTLLTTEEDVYVSVPDLVFHVKGDKLMVYFCKKIKGEYHIANCTYPNVMSTYVCLGNVKIDETRSSLEEEFLKWEHYFFSSTFTGSDFSIPEDLEYKKLRFR